MKIIMLMYVRAWHLPSFSLHARKSMDDNRSCLCLILLLEALRDRRNMAAYMINSFCKKDNMHFEGYTDLKEIIVGFYIVRRM